MLGFFFLGLFLPSLPLDVQLREKFLEIHFHSLFLLPVLLSLVFHTFRVETRLEQLDTH